MAKILIVEDESIVSLDMQHRLQRLGYVVSAVASTGEEAIGLASDMQPDLVLMDIMLQGDIDGVEAADIIRERFGLPVIFLTAYSDEGTLERAKITEPFGYIIKPFKERELYATIEVVLARHEAEVKLRRAHDELEERVQERTRQLAGLNLDLQNQVEVRKRAEVALQHRFDELQAMSQLSNFLARGIPDEAIFQEVLDVLERLQQGDRAAVRLIDAEGHMYFKAWRRLSEDYRGALDKDALWDPGDLPLRPIVIADMAVPEPSALHQLNLQEGIEAAVYIPLSYQGGLVGEFAVFYDHQHNVDDEEVQLLQNIANYIDLALARRKGEDERVALEQRLRESQKMEALGQLAGGIAHDFNNMLTVITGYSELILANLGADETLYQDVKAINDAGSRAAILTGQLLTFSRTQVLRYRVLSINTVVDKMQALLQRVISEDIKLIVDLERDLSYVKADPGQLEQVLMNLIVNACDAMPRGGELVIRTANIELGEDLVYDARPQPGPYAKLEVSDTGCGMSEEILSHIFEPFFTTKSSGKGTGLGLATVYGIVSQSSGYIDISSQPDQGTTCSIYLPEAEALPMKQSKGEAPQGTETLLLAEDEDEVRELASRILRDHGYAVLETCGGSEALDLAKSHADPIHLLLTDVVMPGLSGRELAQQLELLRPDIKILYMSGYTDDTVLRHGIQEEKMPFLQKPFVPETLALKVREVLDG